MGKAYTEEQRNTVKLLLEAGREEESIEKETGVSDRTIRRWKLELERTGRIGKPREARTGRHRVLNSDVEAALFEHVKDKPDMSVDDMLWWLYDTYKIVVGTRTIRRVFERKGDKVFARAKAKGSHKSSSREEEEDDDDEDQQDVENQDEDTSQLSSLQTPNQLYQSPYTPINSDLPAEQQLVQAFQQQTSQPTYPPPPPIQLDGDLPEDEETLQLQLEQIALQKREVELKLKMRRLQNGKGASNGSAGPPTPSILYNPNAIIPTGPKRDSRSKKKIEESKRRTAERQERMLKDLERRSRRRDHLTAEWVVSKDIWPLRAQALLADLMHRYSYYAFSQANADTFELIYRELYQLVDLSKGDWSPPLHDELLRERTKRKMGQLRTKMQKSGEIVPKPDAYNPSSGSSSSATAAAAAVGAFQKATDFTGEAAGAQIPGPEDDPADLAAEMAPLADDAHAHAHQHANQQHGVPPPIHYEQVQDHMQGNLPYAMSPQYPLMNQDLLRAQAPFFN